MIIGLKCKWVRNEAECAFISAFNNTTSLKDWSYTIFASRFESLLYLLVFCLFLEFSFMLKVQWQDLCKDFLEKVSSECKMVKQVSLALRGSIDWHLVSIEVKQTCLERNWTGKFMLLFCKIELTRMPNAKEKQLQIFVSEAVWEKSRFYKPIVSLPVQACYI